MEEKKIHNPMITAYLMAYNVLQTIGWSLIGLIIGQHMLTTLSHKGLYDSSKTFLLIFQTSAILEVLHCALGVVRSSVMLTGFQVASRVFVVWGVLHSVEESQNSIGFFMLLTAWTITEIIRYSFYVVTLCRVDATPITWLRYTLFLGLYPLGVTGELLCIYRSLTVVRSTGLFSLMLPNSVNFAFDYHAALILIMLTYLPVFPMLYGHMLKQRKKIVGGDKSKAM